MSILFLSKLEFTLIVSLLMASALSTSTFIYAQNLDSNNQAEEVANLIEELETHKEYIPEDSLALSKELVTYLNETTNKDIDTGLLVPHE